MTGEWIRFGLTALCVLAGCFALLTAMVGLFRFDFTLNRLHAASIADTLGLSLLVLAVMLAVGLRPVLWKLLLVVILQWCTSPLSGHMLAQLSTGEPESGAAPGAARRRTGGRSMSTVFRILLLIGLLVCAVATALVKKPMRAVIIYMAYSIIMSVVWLLLESPDLAITEAAVGAGITGILFFLTLRRINLIDKDAEHEARREEDHHDDTL